MDAKLKEVNDQSNSANEKNEGKSEEFLNFERALKGILAIPSDEAREIVKRTPYPKDKEESNESGTENS